MVTVNELKKLKAERDLLLAMKKIKLEKLKLVKEIRALKSPRIALIRKVLLKSGKDTLDFLEKRTRPPRRMAVRKRVRKLVKRRRR